MCRDTSPVRKKGTEIAKKKIVRRPWTATDVRELKSLAKKKTGVAKICKALKQTIGATAGKAHQLAVIHLQRTAGPYIRVKSYGSAMSALLPLYP
jgi:hypothetical protein